MSSTARSCILVLKSTHLGIFTHPNFNFRSPAGCLVLSALYAMSMIEQKDVSCTNAVQSFQEKSECWRSYIYIYSACHETWKKDTETSISSVLLHLFPFLLDMLPITCGLSRLK